MLVTPINMAPIANHRLTAKFSMRALLSRQVYNKHRTMPRGWRWGSRVGSLYLLGSFFVIPLAIAGPDGSAEASATFQKYCVSCHNARLKTGGIAIDPATAGQAGQDAELWEKVVQK